MAAVEPIKIFISAECFRIAYELMSLKYEGGKTAYGFPLWVNQAFACELYLKCLIAIKTPVNPKGHKLHELFDQLPKADKAHLRKTYNGLFKNDPSHELFFKAHPFKSDLRSVLEMSSDVFSKIRYAYEGLGSATIIAYFPLPIAALKKVILECHPEWPSALPA